MTVLVPQDGSNDDRCALPVAKVFADLEKASVQTLAVGQAGAGKSAEAILAAAADCRAKVIVMRAPSPVGGPAGVNDEVILAVLRGAVCPVVLVNPNQATGGWALRRILAPHDGSPGVSAALAPAIDIARQAGAELAVLQVACDERALEPGSMAPPMYVDQFQHSWPAWSAEFMHRLASVCPLDNVRVRLLLAHGDPAHEALRTAGEQSADLIVLAWKGRWDAPHAATVKAVLRDAKCPVMVTLVSGG